jgi:hypothetical protein
MSYPFSELFSSGVFVVPDTPFVKLRASGPNLVENADMVKI